MFPIVKFADLFANMILSFFLLTLINKLTAYM